MLLLLIEESVETAWLELNREPISGEDEQMNASFHLLNTNKKHDVDDEAWMLANESAAAFYKPWKNQIARIRDGDTVFLYSNGVGIVAYGRGTGSVEVGDYNGDKDERHFQKLQDFTMLATPMSAAAIKKALARNVPFLRTMSGLSDGAKLLEQIKNA
ncbi:hypothetical protein [Variovorax gossypii]